MTGKIVSLLIAIFFVSFTSFAQIRKVPLEVTTAFSKQYPAAENVSYKDNLKSFNVHFKLNGDAMIAKYNAKGEWKETEKIIELSTIPTTVKEGLEKSKYWDWETEEVSVIDHPSGTEQYRIKVVKNEIQKKYLFYNKSGRLIRDAITI